MAAHYYAPDPIPNYKPRIWRFDEEQEDSLMELNEIDEIPVRVLAGMIGCSRHTVHRAIQRAKARNDGVMDWMPHAVWQSYKTRIIPIEVN